MFLDLTGVESQSFGNLPAGRYVVSVNEAELKETKAGSGQYLALKFKVMDGEHEGRVLFSNYNVKNSNAKAQEIGLQQLKNLVEASGRADLLQAKSVTDFEGATAIAVVKHKYDDYAGEDRAFISYFEPMNKTGSNTTAVSSDVPF